METNVALWSYNVTPWPCRNQCGLTHVKTYTLKFFYTHTSPVNPDLMKFFVSIFHKVLGNSISQNSVFKGHTFMVSIRYHTEGKRRHSKKITKFNFTYI